MTDLEDIRSAISYEEKFLPELHTLMAKRIREYRLSEEKEKEATALLDVLTRESMSHFEMLKAAYLKRGGDADD